MTDGRTEGRTDRRTDGRKDGRTDNAISISPSLFHRRGITTENSLCLSNIYNTNYSEIIFFFFFFHLTFYFVFFVGKSMHKFKIQTKIFIYLSCIK